MAWHTHWKKTAVFFVGSALLSWAFLATRPTFSGITYQFEGDMSQEVTFPFKIDGAPKGPFTVRAEAALPLVHPVLFYFSPDDCIDLLLVNGVMVESKNIPVCDFENGRTINLFGYVHAGANSFRLEMRNLGWPAGFDITVSPFDPLNIFFFFLFLLLLSWYVHGVWHRPNKRQPLTWEGLLTEAERAQCADFLKIALIAIAAVGLLRGTHDLLLRFLYELKNPYTADTGIYLAVGRGILNGFTPYIDLFENKPPGIFLLSAISLYFFDSARLLHLVDALIVLLIPYVLLLWFFPTMLRYKVSFRSAKGIFLLLAVFMFGIGLALYTLLRSGEGQVESYGAFFGVLYLLLITNGAHTFSRRRIMIASLPLAAAIGFKEPFLLSTLAGAIIVFGRDWRQLYRRFLLPLVVVAILGILAMGLAGYLWPYISVYLVEMFGHHIPQGGSPLLNAFRWQKLWYDVLDFSPGFAHCLCLAVFYSLYCRSREWNSALKSLEDVFLLFGAICLTSLSVGIGGAYFNHHFIFAVPFYCAIFLRFILDIFEYRRGATVALVAAGCGVLLLSSAMFSHVTMNYEKLVANFEQEPKSAMTVAKVIDEVLDACVVDRYLFLGGNGPQPYSYTKHSPLGPLFFQYYYSLSPDRTYFRQEFRAALKQAKIVVIESYHLNDMQNEVIAGLEKSFKEEPWGCASRVIAKKKTSGYKVLFRNTN